MGKQALTQADKDALYAMPDDWFQSHDLPYPRVTRSEYRCQRLRDMGYLEWRVVGEWQQMNLKSEYRKTEKAVLLVKIRTDWPA